MTVDWDGAIRMDPSSPYAMARLIGLSERFDLAFANDPDADRHGIVSRSAGLMNPNHYLATAIWYLFRHRPGWPPTASVGKTIVSSSMIDRVAARLGRRLVEVPVGFKYFDDFPETFSGLVSVSWAPGSTSLLTTNIVATTQLTASTAPTNASNVPFTLGVSGPTVTFDTSAQTINGLPSFVATFNGTPWYAETVKRVVKSTLRTISGNVNAPDYDLELVSYKLN